MPLKKKPIKLQRYWPGKVEEEAGTSSSDEENEINKPQSQNTTKIPDTKLKIGSLKIAEKAELDSLILEASDEEEANRRREIIQNSLKFKLEAPIKDQDLHEDTKENIEEESGTSEEEESEEDAVQLSKPIFIPKEQRVTIKDKEQIERESKQKEQENQLKVEERKQQSRQLLEKQNQIELQSLISMDDFNDINDDDDLDDYSEFELWKLRELKRIKRDQDEQEKMELEQAEYEKRLSMTENEKMEHDLLKVDKQQQAKEDKKGSVKFLQKYYHKGAFFMDEESELLNRDYQQSRPDESSHKELLPQILQVREYGKASRSKWTHLVNEDTTKDSVWYQKSDVSDKNLRKMAGLHHPSSSILPGAKRPKTE